jgi:hypothetical protein
MIITCSPIILKKKKSMENVFPAYDEVPLMLKGGVRTSWVGGHAQIECMPSFLALLGV